MFKMYDLALISGQVYQPSPDNYHGYTFQTFSIGKKFPERGWARVVDAPGFPHPAGDFYAALYINFRNGKAEDAVIAVRGTVRTDINNILTDIYSWYSAAMGSDWFDHVPPYYNQAVLFLLRSCPITVGFNLKKMVRK